MYKVYLKFTVKFHELAKRAQHDQIPRRIEDKWKGKQWALFWYSLSIDVFKQCKFSTSQSEILRKNSSQLVFFFQISDQNIQSASRWFTYDAANHRKRKWQNKKKPPVWKKFTVDDIFCLWDTKNRRYRTLHWGSQCLPPYSHQVYSRVPNVNFWKISVRKTIWDLEFSEHL